MDSGFMTMIVMSSLLIDGDKCRVIKNETTEALMKTEDTKTVQFYTANSSPSSELSTQTYLPTNDEAIQTTTASSSFQINKGRLDGGSYSVINFLMAGPLIDGASNTLGTGSIGIAVNDIQPSNEDRNDNTSSTSESDLGASDTSGPFNTTPTTDSRNTTQIKTMMFNSIVSRKYHKTVPNLHIGQETTVQPSQLIMHMSTTIKPMITTTIKNHDHVKSHTTTTGAIQPMHVGISATTMAPTLADNNSVPKPALVGSATVGNGNSYTVKATVYAELVTNDTNIIQQANERPNNHQTVGVREESTFSNAFPADVTQNNTESMAKHNVQFVPQTPSNFSTPTSANGTSNMNVGHLGNKHVAVGTENRTPTTVTSTQSVKRNLSVDNGFQYNTRQSSPIVTHVKHNPYQQTVFKVPSEPVSKSTEYVHRSNQAAPRPVGQYLGNGYQPRSSRYGIRNRPREINYGQISYGSHAINSRQYNTPIQQFPYQNTFNHQRIRPRYQSLNNLNRQYANIRPEQGQLYRNWLNPSNPVSPFHNSQHIAQPRHSRYMSPGFITEGFVNENTHRWYRVPSFNVNVHYNQYHRPGNKFAYRGIVQRSSPINYMWSLFEDMFEI